MLSSRCMVTMTLCSALGIVVDKVYIKDLVRRKNAIISHTQQRQGFSLMFRSNNILLLSLTRRVLMMPRQHVASTSIEVLWHNYSSAILWDRNDLSLAKVTRHFEAFSLPVFHGRGMVLRLKYSCFYIHVLLQVRQQADAILSSGPLMKMTKDLCQNQSWIPLFTSFYCANNGLLFAFISQSDSPLGSTYNDI